MRHLRLYQAIKTIAEEGSFRKASELLTISPSALVRQVKALEEEIGSEIFERLTNGVRLTTAGEIYYRHFIEHLAEIDRANATVADLQGVRIGHVAIAVSDELSQGLVHREIQRFRGNHPGVTFGMTPAGPEDFCDLLDDGRADLALMIEPQLRQGIERLFTEQVSLTAIAPKGSKTIFYPHDLEDHDLIFPQDGSGMHGLLSRFMAQRRVTERPVATTGALWHPTVAPRPSLQFWPTLGIDPDLIQALGGQIGLVQGMPRAEVAVCQKQGRALPIAAARFAAQLGAALDPDMGPNENATTD